MKLLRCFSDFSFLTLAPFLFFFCFDVAKSSDGPSLIRPLHSHADHVGSSVTHEMRSDSFYIQQRIPVAAPPKGNVAHDWDRTVHLGADNTSVMPSGLHKRQGSATSSGGFPKSVDHEVIGARSNGRSAAESRRQAILFMLRVAVSAAVVIAVCRIAHQRRRIEELERLNREHARERPWGRMREGRDNADGGGHRPDEARRRAMDIDEIRRAAEEKGYHMVSDAEYVSLVTKATRADALASQGNNHGNDWPTHHPFGPTPMQRLQNFAGPGNSAPYAPPPHQHDSLGQNVYTGNLYPNLHDVSAPPPYNPAFMPNADYRN